MKNAIYNNYFTRDESSAPARSRVVDGGESQSSTSS